MCNIYYEALVGNAARTQHLNMNESGCILIQWHTVKFSFLRVVVKWLQMSSHHTCQV